MKASLRIFTIVFVIFLMIASSGCGTENSSGMPAEGVYKVDVALTGGTGKASISSPAKLTVREGKMTALIVWSSSNYDYMIVSDEKYLPLTTEGGSAFEIPVAALDRELPVIADTIAMSEPHEIQYTLRFDSSTLKEDNS